MRATSYVGLLLVWPGAEVKGSLVMKASELPSDDQEGAQDAACAGMLEALEQLSVDGHIVIGAAESAELWRAFSGLPARSQSLLRLLFADPQPSYQEIAALTGMPLGSIGPTRARCLQELRERLQAGSRR